MMKVFIAGHNGMVGSAILRQLEEANIETIVRDRKQLDLTSQAQVFEFFKSEKPDAVILAAAKVGGIHANNTYPADFIYQNLMIECNVIHSAYLNGVERLLQLGSSCIYPKQAEQPIVERALLTGVLEPTNEPYAIAKIAGIKLCESYNRQFGVDYRSVMPTNLYGPGDNFHPENSHVIPAMIRRFHEAKINNDTSVTVWGTGQPRREFLHVDDMASGALHVFGLAKDVYEEHTEPMLSHVNIGCGEDVTIRELAVTIAKVVGYGGELIFDTTKPDGTMRKLMSSKKLNSLGWKPQITLQEGLIDTYRWFCKSQTEFRAR